MWSGRTRPSFFPWRVINTQTEAAKGEVSVSPKFKVQPIAAVKSKQQELEQPLTACPGQKRMHTCMRGTAQFPISQDPLPGKWSHPQGAGHPHQLIR